MAVAEIAHNPGLTKEQALELFRKRFEGKCRVNEWNVPAAVRRDFIVERNPFVGVSVKLEQASGKTKFVYNGIAPKL